MWKGSSIWGFECLTTAGVIGTHIFFDAAHVGHTDIEVILAKSLDLLYGIVVLGSIAIIHLIVEHEHAHPVWWATCIGSLFVAVVSCAFVSGAAGLQSFLHCGEVLLSVKMYPVSLYALIIIALGGFFVQWAIGTRKKKLSPNQ